MKLLVSAIAMLMITVPVNAQPLRTAGPETVGMSTARLAKIRTVLQNEIDEGLIPGAVVAIARRGKLVYYEAVGFLDHAARIQLQKDGVFNLASMTKPLVAVGAMTLVEDGRLLLNSPVSVYLPERTNLRAAVITKDANGVEIVKTESLKRPPTIQDLMRHTAGMTYGSSGGNAVNRQYPSGSGTSSPYNITGRELLDKLAGLPLQYQPGTAWEYGLGFDVLGLVIEAIVQQPLGDYLQARIFRPLRMAETSFAVPPVPRHAKPLASDPQTGKPQAFTARGSSRFDCGGACAISTAADYLRFAQMLLNMGELDGARILGRKTVEYMTADHLGPEVNMERLRDYPLINGYGFGLGIAVRRGYGVGGIIGSPGDYHWGGGSGTYFWVDPKEQLAVVFMAATPGETRLRYRQLITTLTLQAIVD